MTRSANVDYIIFERLGDPDGVSLSFATKYPIQVDTLVLWLNGVRFAYGLTYAATGNMIYFTSAPGLGDVIQVAYEAMTT
jgi:hypothetical protein